jgi:hypothetical protein
VRRAAGIAAFVALAVAATVGASPPVPARAQISADEFGLALSRSSIRSGPAILELVNYGEDDHDLALRRVGGTRTYRIGIVHPGKTAELATRLRPGRFNLWCTLSDHRNRGMRATLRVGRRKTRHVRPFCAVSPKTLWGC